MNKPYSKLITYLLGFAFIVKTIAIVFSQQQLETQIENPELHTGIYLSYIANLLFFTAGILGLIIEGKFYPTYIKVLFILIVLWILLVYLRSGARIMDPSTFMGVKGIGPYLGLSVMFTAHPRRFRKMLRVFFWICIILVFAGILNTMKLGIGFDRTSTQMQVRLIAVNLFWLSPVILFYGFKNHKGLTLIIFAFSLLYSLLIVSRSYILLHLLVLLFFMNFIVKFKLKYIVTLLITFGVVFYIFLQLGVIEQASSLLMDRMFDDTRSNQIIEFFAKVDPHDFIWGAGIFSTWSWLGQEYQWLDNQIILSAWWAGFFPIMCYSILILIPVLKFFFRKNVIIDIRGKAFIILLWFLALLGLSIYIVIGTALYIFIIFFILGNLYFVEDLPENQYVHF